MRNNHSVIHTYIHIYWQVAVEQGISVATARMNPAENFCVYFSSDASLSRRKGFVRPFGREDGLFGIQLSGRNPAHVRRRCLIFRIARMRTDSSFSLGCGRARALSIPGVM